MAKKKNHWTAKQEKEELLESMNCLREQVNSLEEQKKANYGLLCELLEDGEKTDETKEKIKFIRERIADIRLQIDDATKRHNDAVDRYRTLEEAVSEKGKWFWTAVEVLGGIALGAGGLALSHRDTIQGRIKNKEEDNFFQAAWKKLFK